MFCVVSQKESWKTHVFADNGSIVYENLTDISSYSYDEEKGQLISFDTPEIARLKAQYILNKGLAGSMFFNISMDKPGNDSLVSIVAERFQLDTTPNHIEYVLIFWIFLTPCNNWTLVILIVNSIMFVSTWTWTAALMMRRTQPSLSHLNHRLRHHLPWNLHRHHPLPYRPPHYPVFQPSFCRQRRAVLAHQRLPPESSGLSA